MTDDLIRCRSCSKPIIHMGTRILSRGRMKFMCSCGCEWVETIAGGGNWCAFCGAFTDHQSGSCPDLTDGQRDNFRSP